MIIGPSTLSLECMQCQLYVVEVFWRVHCSIWLVYRCSMWQYANISLLLTSLAYVSHEPMALAYFWFTSLVGYSLVSFFDIGNDMTWSVLSTVLLGGQSAEAPRGGKNLAAFLRVNGNHIKIIFCEHTLDVCGAQKIAREWFNAILECTQKGIDERNRNYNCITNI